MKQNTRAGLIPEVIIKDILNDGNTLYCEILTNIAGKLCDNFDSCAECIDYTVNWFYEEVQ